MSSTITYNGGAGIGILSGSGNEISANYIYDNGIADDGTVRSFVSTNGPGVAGQLFRLHRQ